MNSKDDIIRNCKNKVEKRNLKTYCYQSEIQNRTIKTQFLSVILNSKAFQTCLFASLAPYSSTQISKNSSTKTAKHTVRLKLVLSVKFYLNLVFKFIKTILTQKSKILFKKQYFERIVHIHKTNFDQLAKGVGYTTLTLSTGYLAYRGWTDSHALRRDIFAYYIIGKVITNYMIAYKLQNEASSKHHEYCGAQFHKLAMTNGGVFVKIGQHLAAMAHVIPDEIVSKLKPLQADCTQRSVEEVLQVMREELGAERVSRFTVV